MTTRRHIPVSAPGQREPGASVEPFTQGADNVAWKVNCEIVVLLGWGPAILMQLAHPLVAAAVADHSTFRAPEGGRIHRLHQTVSAMLALTFGSHEEVSRAAGGINAIHDRVSGRLSEATARFPAGTPYSAHDPSLLRLVHATLLDVIPRTYELYVGPLTEEEKDRYCAEAAGIAPLLGIPDGYLPASMAELAAYMSEMLASGEIAVTETARTLAREIASPPLPRAARPLFRLMRLPMVGLLPPSIREAYGFRWDAREERALRLSAGLVRALLRLTPSPLRHWRPARRAMAAARGRTHVTHAAPDAPRAVGSSVRKRPAEP